MKLVFPPDKYVVAGSLNMLTFWSNIRGSWVTAAFINDIGIYSDIDQLKYWEKKDLLCGGIPFSTNDVNHHYAMMVSRNRI